MGQIRHTLSKKSNQQIFFFKQKNTVECLRTCACSVCYPSEFYDCRSRFARILLFIGYPSLYRRAQGKSYFQHGMTGFFFFPSRLLATPQEQQKDFPG